MGLISKIGNQLKGALNATSRPGKRQPKPSHSIIQKWGSPNYSKTSAEFMYPNDLQMDSARTGGSKTLSMMGLKMPSSQRDDVTVYNQTYSRVWKGGKGMNEDIKLNLVKVEDVKIIDKNQNGISLKNADTTTNYG